MTSFTSANKRKLVIYEETDNPAYDIYNALDIISEGRNKKLFILIQPR